MKKQYLGLWAVCLGLALTVTSCSSSGSLANRGGDGAANSVSDQEGIVDIAFSANLNLSDSAAITATTVEWGYIAENEYQLYRTLDISEGSVSEDAFVLEFSEGPVTGNYHFAMLLEQGGKTYIWSTSNATVRPSDHPEMGDITLDLTGTANILITLDGIDSVNSDTLEYDFDITTELIPVAKVISPVTSIDESGDDPVLEIAIPVPAGTQDIEIEDIELEDNSGEDYDFGDIEFEDVSITAGAATEKTGSLSAD